MQVIGVGDTFAQYSLPYPDHTVYSFCNKCGSSLYKQVLGDDTVNMFIGTLDKRWVNRELDVGQLGQPECFQNWLGDCFNYGLRPG